MPAARPRLAPPPPSEQSSRAAAKDRTALGSKRSRAAEPSLPRAVPRLALLARLLLLRAAARLRLHPLLTQLLHLAPLAASASAGSSAKAPL